VLLFDKRCRVADAECGSRQTLAKFPELCVAATTAALLRNGKPRRLAVCMVCHGELARCKPAYSHLSTFYFMLAAGGALGPVFLVLIAPRIFRDIGEFPLTLLVWARCF
jgi:hypothetical protein